MDYKNWERKADSVIGRRNHMRYIGVFALDGDLIAHAGAPGVQQDVCAAAGPSGMEKARVLNFQIKQRQAKAIVNHMKSAGIISAKIDVANLDFLCIKHGTGNMIGMSCFNVDNSKETVEEIDKACFKLSRHHFTRSDSKSSKHLLNIAATLFKDVVIIGIGLPGEESCISAVQDLTKEVIPPVPTADPRADKVKVTDKTRSRGKGKINMSKELKSMEINDKGRIIQPKQGQPNSTINKEIISSKNQDYPIDETMTAVDMRKLEGKPIANPEKSQEHIRRTKSVDDIDAGITDRLTGDFGDERVKFATIRSIEALRNIGPFTESMIDSDDSSMETMRCKSTEMLIQTSKKNKPQSRSKSMGSADTGSRLNRRPSRATMV